MELIACRDHATLSARTLREARVLHRRRRPAEALAVSGQNSEESGIAISARAGSIFDSSHDYSTSIVNPYRRIIPVHSVAALHGDHPVAPVCSRCIRIAVSHGKRKNIYANI